MQSQSAIFGGADFPNWSKISVSYLCWSHSIVNCRCMQIIFSNQNGNHASQYAACNYWKHCFVPGPWAFIEGDVQNHWSITRCLLKSPKRCYETNSLTQGLRRYQFKTIRTKEGRVLRITRRNRFRSVSWIKVGLIRRIGHCVAVRTFPSHLVLASYRSRHRGIYPR